MVVPSLRVAPRLKIIAFCLLIETIISRFFYVLVVGLSFRLGSYSYSSLVIQSLSISALLYVCISFGRNSFYTSVLPIKIRNACDIGLWGYLIPLWTSSLVAVLFIGFVLRLISLNYQPDLQEVSEKTPYFILYLALLGATCRIFSERSLFLAYDLLLSYSLVDAIAKISLLICFFLPFSQSCLLILLMITPAAPILIIIPSMITVYWRNIKVVRVVHPLEFVHIHTDYIIKSIIKGYRLALASSSFALNDFLVSVYTALPLSLAPSFFSPKQIVFLAFFYKLSEGLQLVCAPYARVVALKYLFDPNKSLVRPPINYFFCYSKQQLRILFYRLIFIFRSNMKTILVSLFLLIIFICCFSRLSWDGYAEAMTYLNGINLIPINASFYTWIYAMICFLCLVIAAQSVVFSYYLDLIFKANAMNGFLLNLPPLIGAVVFCMGLSFAKLTSNSILFVILHAMSELSVLITMLRRPWVSSL